MVLGVATHEPRPDFVKGWLRTHPVTFPVLLDDGRRTYEAYRWYAGTLSGGSFPKHVVVGPDGRVAGGSSAYRPDFLAALLERGSTRRAAKEETP